MKNQIVSNEYFTINYDSAKNRVYASFNGFWGTMQIMDEYRSYLTKVCNMVKSNFTMVADLRSFKTLPNDLVPKQKQSMDDLAKAGMSKVAVIVPESVISEVQLKSSMNETAMPEKQFSTVEGGEEWLDSVSAN